MTLRPILYTSAAVLLATQADATVFLSFDGPQQVTGGGAGMSLVDTTNDTNNWMDAYIAGTSNVPLYMQFTMRVDNNAGETGAGGFFTGFQLHQSGAERLAVGNTWGSLNWGGFFGPGDFDLTGPHPYVVGAPETFVLKLDQANNTATIWFNPDTSLTEAEQPAAITTIRTGLGSNDTFNDIRLRAGNNSGATTFSNITIQDTTVFAVPEPSTAALGAVGLLALLRRRRP